MSKRIARKTNKSLWVKGFGAIKATRGFVYEVRGGRVRKTSLTRLYLQKQSETHPSVFYIEKILIRVFPAYEDIFL